MGTCRSMTDTCPYYSGRGVPERCRVTAMWWRPSGADHGVCRVPEHVVGAVLCVPVTMPDWMREMFAAL